MNTFERHRQYLLRTQRTRRLRRRAALTVTFIGSFLCLWTMVSRFGPTKHSTPEPVEIGHRAIQQVAGIAVHSINAVHAELYPEFRSRSRAAALRLLSDRPAAPVLRSRHVASPRAFSPRAFSPRVASSRVASSRVVVLPLQNRSRGQSRTTVGLLDSALPGIGTLRVNMEVSLFPNDNDTASPDVALQHSRRTLDILLIGMDSRLGQSHGRADALHLLTIDVDELQIEITGIPRGTYSDLGYENDASNIIANVRAARGRTELRKRIARMCRKDSIPFFVEIGFSDAIGILQLLGYNDPGAELQSLRSRRGYQYGDHSRSYKQALFIRSAMLRLLPLLEGATGDLLLRAGLEFMETNLTMEQCRGIAYLLNDADISRVPSLISVTLRSRFRKNVERASGTLLTAEDFRESDISGKRAERRIRKALNESMAYDGDARRVRAALWTMFTQHAWLQIKGEATRRELRDALASRLIDACAKLQDEKSIAGIHRTLRADSILFSAIDSVTFAPPSAMRQ